MPNRVPSKPFEEILWTSDLSKTKLYAPGTPESLDLAKRLRNIYKNDSFPEPVYVAPFEDWGRLGNPNDVFLIYPFTGEIAEVVQKSFEHKIKKTEQGAALNNHSPGG
jgi:hypothetical protein